ncbi:MAG: tetratricopeptide repeat protein [Flavobacteriaceae bacterium]|nr:tetratricopeptide repeat protein [Flavobacteriaceae bacterium]
MKKPILVGLLVICSFYVSAQETQNLIYQGNQKLNEKAFSEAESKYRKAISDNPNKIEGIYNLGNTHYQAENYQEATQRYFQAQKLADSKEKRHKAFHNMGNSYMKKKDYPQAVEAYKNALRNNPNDEQTRYNYALAKSLLEQERQDDSQQQDQQQDNSEDQDQQDNSEDQDQQDNSEDQDQQDNSEDQDQQDDDSQDQNQENEEQNSDDSSQQDNQSDQKQENSDQQESQQQPSEQNRLSPQQIKNLLQAMDNQEKKVQEKINAQKVQGIPTRGKDW